MNLRHYYVGCKGWRNQTWIKEESFYPANLDPKDYLAYYAKIFDFVEVNLSGKNRNPANTTTTTTTRAPISSGSSSYYSNIINKFTFRKWAENTPDNFRFAVKLSSEIIGGNDGYTDTNKISNFLEELAPLEKKILAIGIKTPSKLTLNSGKEWLNNILDVCTYHGYSVALEFDHFSWFQDLTYNILKKYNAAVVWCNNNNGCGSYPVVTADFLYLRISQNEKNWIEKIKEREIEEKELDFAIVVVEQPSKANYVLKLLNLSEKKYGHSQWLDRVIMSVDLNAFYPSCEELRDPALKGKPHAVIMTDQQPQHRGDNITKGVVASCSYEARKSGVTSAMALSKAKELCPGLILHPVDMPYYRQVSEKVMSVLEEHSDILEQTSIDEAYLDCTRKIIEDNTTEQFNIQEYATRIKSSVKHECGLLCSIGVAPTKSAAKVASDFNKPDGLTIIYPDKLVKFFKNLEVERISGIGVKTQHILKEEMGIQTIGQLANCDVQRLTERFGKKNGIWMWQVANGRDNERVIPRGDHVSLSTEQTLNRYTTDKKVILSYLNELADEIHERLRREGYEFKTIGIKLVRSDFSIETREMSFANYQNKRESIVSVLEELLDRFYFSNDNSNKRSTATMAVRKVGIKASNLVRMEKKKPPQQKTLLDYL